ncbi:MAG: uroporphyrinogen decarboxylase family protein, partial [Planctomycetota bacterium]
MGQRYHFGIVDTAVAESAGVSLYDLHTDVDAICRAYEAIAGVAERLGVDPPRPSLAGMAYPHVSALGNEVMITAESVEPWTRPCIHSPEDIDALAEPDDYLAAGIVPRRLELAAELKKRRPDASDHIGHDFEGPVTTAALMMGQDFFTLPYDDPARARRLLEFVNYARAIRAHQGRAVGGGRQGACDDFAGMFGPDLFGEFVVPYWNMLYEGLEADTRGLHSELLR